jgi:hypothetical protein
MCIFLQQYKNEKECRQIALTRAKFYRIGVMER